MTGTICTGTDKLTTDSAGNIICGTDQTGGGAAHNFLSATHTDTVAASPTRGDIVVANSTPAWARFAVGGSNTVFTANGTDPAWSATPTVTSLTATSTVTGAVVDITSADVRFSGLAAGYGKITSQGILTSQLTPILVPDGGTGSTTLTSNGVLYGNGAGAMQATTQGGANTVLTANAGAPAFSTSPTITNLTSTGTISGAVVDVSTSDIRFAALNCSTRSNGGALTVTSQGSVVCSDDDSGSGSTNSFETWSVPSGTNPVADSATDTATFTVSGPMVVTGTASSDTIDFTVSTAPGGGSTAVATGRILTGGAGIATIGDLSTDRTISVDTTEIDTTTWGTGGNGSNVWTFGVVGTDPTLTFSNLAIATNSDVTATNVAATALNCSTYANGGTLTTNASGSFICAPDDTALLFGTRCAVLQNLSGADDNIPMGSWSQEVTVDQTWCTCTGSCTDMANIALEDNNGNRMAHFPPTCTVMGTIPSTQSITGTNVLLDKQSFRFDVVNNPSPETDTYELCVRYSYDRVP